MCMNDLNHQWILNNFLKERTFAIAKGSRAELLCTKCNFTNTVASSSSPAFWISQVMHHVYISIVYEQSLPSTIVNASNCKFWGMLHTSSVCCCFFLLHMMCCKSRIFPTNFCYNLENCKMSMDDHSYHFCCCLCCCSLHPHHSYHFCWCLCNCSLFPHLYHTWTSAKGSIYTFMEDFIEEKRIYYQNTGMYKHYILWILEELKIQLVKLEKFLMYWSFILPWKNLIVQHMPPQWS